METYPRKTLDKLVEEQIIRWQSNGTLHLSTLRLIPLLQ
jgi:hypothetical protein